MHKLMIPKKYLIPLFFIMAIAQWVVPINMITGSEKVLKKGQLFKFKTRPVDPNDPFRGKYIQLDFEANTFEFETGDDWTRGAAVFVELIEDIEGYAQIKRIHKTPPSDDISYIKAKIRYQFKVTDTTQRITVDYPFDRFYMEESKALPAEKMYRKRAREEHTITYAEVYINEGDAVLENVFIDGVPIIEATLEFIKEEQNSEVE